MTRPPAFVVSEGVAGMQAFSFMHYCKQFLASWLVGRVVRNSTVLNGFGVCISDTIIIGALCVMSSRAYIPHGGEEGMQRRTRAKFKPCLKIEGPRHKPQGRARTRTRM